MLTTQKIKRILLLGWLLLYQYRAFRAFHRMSDKERQQHLAIPKHLVQSLLKLGPLFIKVGQILSTRPDVLPKEYIAELALLQEHVPPFPYSDVRTIVREEFQQYIHDLFQSFEEIPVAAASLAQVHFAELFDGTPVAVKIQRPQAKEAITADLALLSGWITLFCRLFPKKARRFNLAAGFQEFGRYTLQELDFVLEANTMERFRHNFADQHDVIIPQVYHDLVKPRVLTMERITGQRLSEITPTLSTQERKQLSHRLLEIEMKMFISDGVFHADLHPGNILFLGDEKIALLDFGMYGELSQEHRDHFILYWLAVFQRQTRRAFYHLVRQTRQLKNADEEAYYQRFKEMADKFYSSITLKVSLMQTYLAIIVSGAKYGFVFPSDLLLQAKALTTAEALAFTLTPDFKFAKDASPILAHEFALRATDFARLKETAEQILPELLLFGELPPASSREQATTHSPLPFDWSEVLKLLDKQVRALQPDTNSLRSIIDSFARSVLECEYAEDEIDTLLDEVWGGYDQLAPSVPSQETVGGRFMVHASAIEISMYQVLLLRGQSKEQATKLIYDMVWHIYTKMGAIPWDLATLFRNNEYDKLRFATTAFRTFPFSSPSYRWQEIEAEPGVVAFNCLKCPVAEYFQAHNLAELCVSTWCTLDDPLAKQWGAELKRTGTIAGGAKMCDFRWHGLNVPEAKGSSETLSDDSEQRRDGKRARNIISLREVHETSL